MNLIVAVDENFAIGRNNKLLFHISKDMIYFKKMTTNKIVVMGEKTYLSLPKKPLQNRTNIVLSQEGNVYCGAITVKSLEELFEVLKNYNTEDVFVIGGASVYNQLMDYCKNAYITKIFDKKEADVFIENIDQKKNWKLQDKSDIFEENGIKFQFCTYTNKNVQEKQKGCL